MTRIRAAVFCLLLALYLPFAASAQDSTGLPDVRAIGLGTLIPLDPVVRTGRLDNGLTYFIRKNARPERRAELRLAVNAGSVLETDAQQGLAHFCEHMCFNGTRQFSKDAIVTYMESIGMRFGANLNAGTGLDETVYQLQIPTDRPGVIDSGFRILRDWAHDVSFEDGEIDKERGVILEELRLDKGAGKRLQDKQLPVLFHGSKYADRMPIGKEEVIASFPHDTLRAFYRTWYRPDLMAVVVVGDVDVDAIEARIRAVFADIPAPAAPIQVPVTPVPDHQDILYSIESDPELTTTSVSVTVKCDVRPLVKGKDYRDQLVDRLIDAMLNARLSELRRLADPPFVSAYSSYGRMLRSKDAFSLDVYPVGDAIGTAYDAALTELVRVRLHGFTATELGRAKAELLRATETRYNERDKSESGELVWPLVSHFLTRRAAPGIAVAFALQKKYMDGIGINEVNTRARQRTTGRNTVVTVSMPGKPGMRKPTEAELGAIAGAAAARQPAAYVDTLANRPLAEPPANATAIAASRAVPELGITEWRLSNGMRIVLKPTTFKNDEIYAFGISPGGTSLAADADEVSADNAVAILQQSGAGPFSQNDLTKLLAGKLVMVMPFLSELMEGLFGRTTPQDLEALFQLFYLHATAPRRDTAAYRSVLARLRTQYENAALDPASVFQDTIAVTMRQYHPRRRPMTVARLAELDLDRALSVYRDRFADAGDFTFIIIGSFDTAAVRPLVLRYLGSLPVTGRAETWRDLGIRTPEGVVEKTVRRGIEKKSSVEMHFTGPFDWTLQERYDFQSLIDVLTIRLREEVREEKGGTYGVSVSGGPQRYPRSVYSIAVSFGCDPDRVEELTGTVMQVIATIAAEGVAQDVIDKVKEMQRRERETNLKENGFWIGMLLDAYYNNDDPADILRYDALINGLTPGAVQRAAARYLDAARRARFVLLPE
jgi:zinc protease